MLATVYSFCCNGFAVFPWDMFWLLSLIGYFVIFMIFPFNRKKRSLKVILIAFLIAEMVFDVIWAILFMQNRVYIEFMVNITYGLFMWLIMLVCAGTVSTLMNYKKIKSKQQ
ncbi:MAG: hypothetical protein J6L59_02860 [Clostridia bacterium]|nr:hypothetical protein [Clostridia bacterium]